MMIVSAPIRGLDKWGSGAYGAPRGRRAHRGIDVACYAGSKVAAERSGLVTKLGYPYSPSDPKKGHLRYVEIEDEQGNKARYFYIKPYLELGDLVSPGDFIGETQGLAEIYPGITDHFHFEVKDSTGVFVDPISYLESTSE